MQYATIESAGEGIVQLAQQRVLELTSALHLQQPNQAFGPDKLTLNETATHVSPPAQSTTGQIGAKANSLEDLKQQELNLKVTSELEAMLHKAQAAIAGGSTDIGSDASTLQVVIRDAPDFCEQLIRSPANIFGSENFLACNCCSGVYFNHNSHSSNWMKS